MSERRAVPPAAPGTADAPGWALRLPRHDAEAKVASMRGVAGVEVLVLDDVLWLRGPGGDEALLRRVAGLCGGAPSAAGGATDLALFDVDGAGYCRRPGDRLWHQPLPRGAWLPVADFVLVELPGGSAPGRPFERVELKLVRGGPERRPNVLVTPGVDLRRWVGAAIEPRLRGLRFAARGDGALVHGLMLPPLAGQAFCEQDGVALPAGHRLDPPISASVVAERWALATGDLLMVALDGRMQRIDAGHFVSMSRSAVRATWPSPGENPF